MPHFDEVHESLNNKKCFTIVSMRTEIVNFYNNTNTNNNNNDNNNNNNNKVIYQSEDFQIESLQSYSAEPRHPKIKLGAG